MLVDALGNPLKCLLTSGATGDNPQAMPLREGPHTQEVLADQGDHADTTRADSTAQRHATATIPPKQSRVEQRVCDSVAYQERHLIAGFSGKLKYFRRVFARFDQYATRFLAFIHCASPCSWLK